MNGYQKKRIIEAMRQAVRLSVPERNFIHRLAEKKEDYELTTKQNHRLNQISQKML